EADVVEYRAVEEKVVLQDHAELVAVIPQLHGLKIFAVDANDAGRADTLVRIAACGETFFSCRGRGIVGILSRRSDAHADRSVRTPTRLNEVEHEAQDGRFAGAA